MPAPMTFPDTASVTRDRMAPMASMDDRDGDIDTMVTCPGCGHQFAPQDTDGDAGLLAQGTQKPLAPPQQAAPPAMPEKNCAECGGKMEGGRCVECGYGQGNSPMRENISKHIGGLPEGNKPNPEEVYSQGIRARQRMREGRHYGGGV